MKQMVYKEAREVETLDEGTYKGMDYIILSLGVHPTAYVRIPRGHQYFKKKYDDIDIDVHGGLTYASGDVANAKKVGWWIGWDYAHSGDYIGYDGVYDRNGRHWTTEEILDDVKSVIDQLRGTG